ncbi:stonustoxin subunit alpha-like [Cololabis saira]|uniref:stonustoxin subunit alpha-like n=1 Tax=Cololabis saira TaxID=129043 RepID=UPI002AD1F675|nr:stonustoxin subunit alpha-like [Cololabis saira]
MRHFKLEIRLLVKMFCSGCEWINSFICAGRPEQLKKSTPTIRRHPSFRTVRVEPAGQRWLTPGLRKYSCRLTVDTNTVHNKIKLSDDNRKMMLVGEDQSYPDHPHRFDLCDQLLCREVLTGRCHWEVQWSGRVSVSVSYRRISRKGGSDDCRFGGNDHSWSLDCSPGGRVVEPDAAAAAAGPSRQV